MIFADPANKALLKELLAVLDEEIALLNKKTGELESLSGAIVERDNDRFGPLLEQMEQTHQGQAATDVKLDALRNTLAEKIGCEPSEMKLSRLIDLLDEQDRLTVDYRRQQIILLTEQLRKQHAATMILLAESARINRMLLENLFPQSQPVKTYSAAGADSWRPATGLLDTKR
jgi:flagellar biosynthesis/type III secretory pathway chaperone